MSPRFRSLLLALVAAALVVSVGCTSTTTTQSSATPTPIPPPVVPEKPTYTVKRGEVVDSISFTGRISPVDEEELYFKNDGRVKKVYVERGQLVEQGTVLAELENDDLLRQQSQAQIELETAKLNLELAQENQKYVAEKSRIDLDVAKAQLAKLRESLAAAAYDVKIAQSNLAQAKAGPTAEDLQIAKYELERAKNTLWSAQINRDSTCGQTQGAACDAAQASVNRAELDVKIEELSLAKLTQAPSAAKLLGLEAALDKALQSQRALQADIAVQEQRVALAEMDVQRQLSDVDPQLSKAVERAKLSLERLQAQVAQTQVIAPISGKVTSVGAYEGRTVQAYKVVFVVADESKLEVKAEPLSTALQRLSEGLECAIALSNYPGKELPGKIQQLPYPYGRGGGANVEEADKLTHITFDPQDLQIEPGDLVKINVILERKADVLWLPPAAIRTFAGRKFVVVQEEGRQQRVDVTIGIESLDRVEIADGLKEGQIVVGQ